MNDSKNVREKLNNAVELAFHLIDLLYEQTESNKKLLDDLKVVLLDYQKSGDLNISRRLREIDSRPSKEGANTDFTTGISLRVDGRYMSLQDLILDIEDLAFLIESM